MGITAKYNTALDLSGFTMTDDYNKIMQSLNGKKNEVCNHVMHWVQTREEQCIFSLRLVLKFKLQKHSVNKW